MVKAARAFATVVSLLGLIATATPAWSLPLLSEVLYDAPGSDDGQSFVEIFGEPGSSLEGFVLEGVNGANGTITLTLALSGVIPSDGLFVVADGAAGVTQVIGADLIANFDFQNGPDSIVLRSGDAIVDALGYGVFDTDPFFAGEGAPAPDAPAGSSLARLFADIDTDDNAADWIVLGLPTPGAAPRFFVPEPSAATLLGVGLVLLAHGSRRRPRRR
jgi:hypothetical protein